MGLFNFGKKKEEKVEVPSCCCNGNAETFEAAEGSCYCGGSCCQARSDALPKSRARWRRPQTPRPCPARADMRVFLRPPQGT